LGFERTITSLDNRQVKVAKAGTSQPGDQIRINGEGFPVKNYDNKGDLFVTLSIELPSTLSENKQKMWRTYFQTYGSV